MTASPEQTEMARQMYGPPNAFLCEELATRGWTVRDLAERSGLDDATVTALVRDGAPVTAPLSAALGRAFGTSPGFWLRFDQRVRERVNAR
jgi:plasmid maintenance system antidote protein VapI